MADETASVYYLEPGCIYASSTGDVIRTVLGSCVAVCIWDSELRIGGACSFLYPGNAKKKNRTAKYAEVAIAHLVDLLIEMGCSKANLFAQIFGGGVLLKKNEKEAYKRVSSGRKTLQKLGITVLSEDIGGKMGRKILFDSVSGHIAVLKVNEIREGDWF